jgi:hypothetical protein
MKNPLPGQARFQPFSPARRQIPGPAGLFPGLVCRYGQYPSLRFVRTMAGCTDSPSKRTRSWV